MENKTKFIIILGAIVLVTILAWQSWQINELKKIVMPGQDERVQSQELDDPKSTSGGSASEVRQEMTFNSIIKEKASDHIIIEMSRPPAGGNNNTEAEKISAKIAYKDGYTSVYVVPQSEFLQAGWIGREQPRYDFNSLKDGDLVYVTILVGDAKSLAEGGDVNAGAIYYIETAE